MRRNLLSMLLAVLLSALGAMAQESVMYTDPAPGDVTEISVIKLYFNGEWARGSKLSAKITLTGPEGVEIPKVLNYSTGQYVEISLEDDAVLTTPGEYVLTIPACKYQVEGVDIEETSFTYNIVEELFVPMTVDPAPGVVSELSAFTLSFNGEWSLGTNRRGSITVTGPEGVDIPKVLGASNGTEYEISFEDDEVVTAPGEYTLTIPAGKFAIDEVDLQEMKFVYTIKEIEAGDFPAYAVEPAPGTYQTIDQGFTIKFDTETAIEVDAESVYLTGPEGDVNLFVEVPRNMTYVNIIPVNDNGTFMPLDKFGNYRLILSVGAVKIGDVINEEPIVFDYLVTGYAGGDWQGGITATPADNSVVKSLKNITLVFDGAKAVKVDEFAKPGMFPALYDADTDSEVVKSTVFADDNYLDISLYTLIENAGHYKLVVPAGLLTVDGVKLSAEIVLTYEIEAADDAFDYTYNITPADKVLGVDEPVSITFEADDLAAVKCNEYAWGDDMPHFTNTMGAYNPNLMVVNDGKTVTFTHQWPFEQDGVYTLVIPARYFTLVNAAGEEVKTPTIEVVFNVGTTGIDALPIDSGTSDIYNIKGVKVSGTDLPAGIYIISGRKVKK